MSVTIPNPSGIDAAGMASVYFVEALTVTDGEPVPTKTEIDAGTVLSCAIYTWPTSVEQSTSTQAKYCDKQPRQRLGKASYSAGPVVYDYDPQGTDVTGNYAHYAALVPGTVGYIIDRRGVDSMAPIAVGDVVDVWAVTLGARVRMDIDPTNEDGEALRTQQSLSVQKVWMDVEIAA